MTEREELKLEILESLLDRFEGTHPDYYLEIIDEEIDMIKYGI